MFHFILTSSDFIKIVFLTPQNKKLIFLQVTGHILQNENKNRPASNKQSFWDAFSNTNRIRNCICIELMYLDVEWIKQKKKIIGNRKEKKKKKRNNTAYKTLINSLLKCGQINVNKLRASECTYCAYYVCIWNVNQACKVRK